MPTCCVPGCSGIKHLFLPPKETMDLWKERIPNLTSKDRVCYKHFIEDSVISEDRFIINGETVLLPRVKWALEKDAVPTIFPITCKSKCSKRKKLHLKNNIEKNIITIVISQDQEHDNVSKKQVKNRRKRKSSISIIETNIDYDIEKNISLKDKISDVKSNENPTQSCEIIDHEYSKSESTITNNNLRQNTITKDESFETIRSKSQTKSSLKLNSPLIEIIKETDNGSTVASPTISNTHEQKNMHLKYKISDLKKKLSLCKRQLSKSQENVASLEYTLRKINRQVDVSKCSALQKEIINMIVKKEETKTACALRYPDLFLVECMLLRKKSPSVYRYIRERNLLPLPTERQLLSLEKVQPIDFSEIEEFEEPIDNSESYETIIVKPL